MCPITYLLLTSCTASVFHKSTRSQLDRQKSYTEQRICTDEKFIFFPYQKTGIFDCQKCLKWIISTFDFVLSAETEISKIYKQKFLSSFRVRSKKQLALYLKHTTA